MTARRLLVVALSASLLGACVSVPPEPYVETIIVAPPPLRVEHPGYPPYAGYVWTTGYWSWGGQHYAWVPGRWVAPRPGHVWVAPRWVQEGRYWRMHDGRWERPPPPQAPAVTAPPRPVPDGRWPGAEPPATRPAIRPNLPANAAPRPDKVSPPQKTSDRRVPGDGMQDRRVPRDARPVPRPDHKLNTRPDPRPGTPVNAWPGERLDAAPPARRVSPPPQKKPEVRSEVRPEMRPEARPEVRPATGQARQLPPQGEARTPRQGSDEMQTRRSDAAKRQVGNDSPRLDSRPNSSPEDRRRSR